MQQLQSNLLLPLLQSKRTPIFQTFLSLQYLSSLPSPVSHSYSKSFPFHASSTSSSPWFSLLRTAISTADLFLGKTIHALIITSGGITDRLLTNNLITMYCKCGSLSSARQVFDKSPNRDLVTWNSILSAYALFADLDKLNIQEGFRIFRLLLDSSPRFSVSKHTLAPVLKLSLLSGYVWASEMVHGHSVKVGLELDMFVSGALVNIYCKFRRVRDARVLFNDIFESERDAVLWNVMLKAYMEMGFQEEMFRFFSEFHRSGFSDAFSVRYFLSGFPDVDFHEGKKFMHQVQAYATKLFPYDHAFDNVILWNKTLSEYHQDGDNWAVVECFMDMCRSKVGYDSVTTIIILAAITDVNNLKLGQQIHSMTLKSGLDIDVSVANSLINMYSKTDGLISARKVFTNMEDMDLVSWNSMIASCVQSGLEEESVALFLDLLSDGFRPDHFTFASVLKACSSLAGLSLSEQIHVHALKTGFTEENFVCTALIDVYSRNGRMNEAEFLLKDKDEFDLASWNAMMHGYIICNYSKKTLELFSLMHRNGERSDEFTLATALKACSSFLGLEQGTQIHAYLVKIGVDSELYVDCGILDMYIKCGSMVDAYRVFQGIPTPDQVAWTAMISGCVENGDEERALQIYHQMRESGIVPDEYTFTTLIKASSCLTALEQGRQIHADVIKSDCGSDPFVWTSLIDMYAKCGNIEDSYNLFKRVNVQELGPWNAMIVGLAQHGHAEEALELFENMKLLGIQPDGVTFIGVISACGHSGLTSEAESYFDSMYNDFGIQQEIEHCSCLIDALGRAGRVNEAEKLIDSMPYKASSSMYKALLGACRSQGDTETGKRVASRLLALEPSDSSAYVILSNIYAAANQWDGVTSARHMMKKKNIKKDPGFSWIMLKNKVHLFVVDDRSHPQSDMIYDKVEDMIRMIKEEGYVPDNDYALLSDC